MKEIHINCDLGEGSEDDAELMPYISACNIACGGHAGTLESMHETVALALEHGVEIGAHPSYPDKEAFGRIPLEMAPDKLKRSLVAQILSLKQIAEAEGGKIVHVKPHGALYNEAQKDETIARIILDALLEFDKPLSLYAPENSVIATLAEGRVKVIYEAFADRNYNEDGSLVSRIENKSLIIEKEDVFEHLLSMFSQNEVLCKNGEKIHCHASTFCLHSDTPGSVEILKFLHQKLGEKTIKIKHSA